MNDSHRWIESGLAVLGGLLAAAYVLGVEVIPRACYSMGVCPNAPPVDQAFPWGVTITVVALVLPKTVGRASAGAVWSALAGVAARVSGRGPQGGSGGAAG